MRDFDGGKEFDGAGEQRSEEKDDQNPCVGVKPSEFPFHGAEHFMELRPMDTEEHCHGIAGNPVDCFQDATWLDQDSVALKMQDDACNECSSKGYDQYDADIGFILHND